MRLFCIPTDVLFFRGAQSFTAGEGTAAQSLFPPTPETMQGMLRALIASQWAPTLAEAFAQPGVRELVGDRTSYGRFRLSALTLGRRCGDRVERLFPAPAHLQRLLPEGRPILLRPAAAPQDGASGVTNLPDGLRPLVPPDAPDASAARDRVVEPFGDWLAETELAACLAGETAAITGTPASAIYTMEPRMGIGLQHARKTVEEGLLYQTAVVRMAPDYGFVADIELAPAAAQPTGSSAPPGRVRDAGELRPLLRLPQAGWAQLGGERRIVRYEVLPDDPVAAATPIVRQPGQRPLLYLAAPAYFRAGWRPEAWASTFGPPPVAAAVPRMQLIGGWRLEPDSARGAPKALRRCVPAGSVYFFDSPLAVPGPYGDYGCEIGYGYAIEGAW